MSDVALPYPVLGRGDDYVGVDFQVTIKVDECELIQGEVVRLPFIFDLSDESIRRLIAEGKAKFGFEISCSCTAIRYIEFVGEHGELCLEPKKFFREVRLSPRVFVVDDISNFSSPYFNPEFGDIKFDLEPGDFLAATDDDIINLDFDYLRFEDAIKVLRQDDLAEWVYEFNLDGEAIIIGMGKKFHNYWNRAKEDRHAGMYLIMSVYKDCMVAALEHISMDLGDGFNAWERGLSGMLEEKKIRLSPKTSFSDLNLIAQELLKDDGVKKVDFS